MCESIVFGAWQNAEQVPDTCPLCQEENPIFEYRIVPGRHEPGPAEKLNGYCCLPCGQRLLASLQDLIRARWAQNGTGEGEH